MKKLSKIKSVFLLIITMLILSGNQINAVERSTSSEHPQIFMQNPYWQITLEPAWGGRASRLYSVTTDYDFVSQWGEPRERRGEVSREGGAFRGMMSGSYVSTQPNEPYEITEQSETAVSMRYSNNHPMLDGLVEERRIELIGQDAVLSIRITNTGQEARVIYYRFHDMTGIGERNGLDSIYIVPRKNKVTEFVTGKPGERINRHFPNPPENWYALADLVNNRGILVSSNTPIANVYFWGSGRIPFNPNMRTSEMFFPQIRLLPGETWETEISFRAFSPSDPNTDQPDLDPLLTAEYIRRNVISSSERMLQTGLPFDAELSIISEPASLTITPVHGASPRLGSNISPDYGKALNKIQLTGTPGEVLAFAVALKGIGSGIENAQIVFSNFKSGQHHISNDAFEPYYVAGETQLLVKDWHLSNNIPLREISHIKNEVIDASSITPFSLMNNEVAWVWTRLRIPVDAESGSYVSTCFIKSDQGVVASFDIKLRVRPYQLKQAHHKTYGTFFDYHIRPQNPDEMWESRRNSPYALSRNDYYEAMKFFNDIGVNGLVIYVSQRDDLLWALDRAKELGMDGHFVIISPYNIRSEDVEMRDMSAFGWTVDEPARYSDFPTLITAYDRIIDRGFQPTFTPNVPVGLLLTDLLPEMHPIINTNGNIPYLAEATRRYKKEGRTVFWYECDGLGTLERSAERRALRGIYLWKEPIDGIWDWDHSSNRPNLSVHHLAGFAGTKILPRLGMENIRQGLIDMRYLHTLEMKINESNDASIRAEAEQLLDWIRMRFHTDYTDALRNIQDPQYLDDIRQAVGDMIEKLVNAQ